MAKSKGRSGAGSIIESPAMTGAGPITESSAMTSSGGYSDDDVDIISVEGAGEEWGWKLCDPAVRSAPTFLPLDTRCTRRVRLDEGRPVADVTLRISGACRELSIHGPWDDGSSTTPLSSMEGVRMEVTVYSGGTDATTPHRILLVEVRRRRGDAVAFHNYRRHLLDAAEGMSDRGSRGLADGLNRPQASERSRPRASLGRPMSSKPSIIPRPGSIAIPSPPGDMPRPGSIARPPPLGGTKRPSLLGRPSDPPSNQGSPKDATEKALRALGRAASLIKKDRVDARRIGLESLELLTDRARAGGETAGIAARVVLLGTAREDANESKTASTQDCDALFDESAELGIRETVLETIVNGGGHGLDRSESDSLDGFERDEIEREFTDVLFSLCLTILGNALRAAAEGVPGRFVSDVDCAFRCDILSSLMGILGEAEANPHDACRAARCLGVLFGEYSDANDQSAEQVVAEALRVGRRGHSALADASAEALRALGSAGRA